MLGNNLAYYFREKYEILGLYCSHPVSIRGIRTEKKDLLNSNDNALKTMIEKFKPSILIHCASLANVDDCETNPELARKINVVATRSIVEAIADKDIKLIYISTDAVYDGIKGIFSENDPIHPLNCYGRSKFEGELEVLKKAGALILRTNLFGWNIQEKRSLGEWILVELKAGRKIGGFRDACFSTIYTMELARVIDIAIQNQLSGIYNCGSTDCCSKYDFALKIADRFGFDKALVAPISIDDFNFRAKRGKNLSLNVGKLQEALDYELPTIEQSIDEFYRDYKCGLPTEIKRNQFESQKGSFFIPYGRHWIDENDTQAVVEVLRSDRITQGPKVEEFEMALSEYCGVRYAVAVNSGTSALHIACLAAGVKTGDEVITSPITFVASANCAVYCSATPIFSDIDIKTYNLSPENIRKKITKKTRAVIPVHFAGQSCDMGSISQTVNEKEAEFKSKIFIIEDACHALGSRYKGNQVGSCQFSDMAVMSFHPVKHITTGEGGAVLTNDETLYKKLKQLRSHGITNNPEEFVCSERAFDSADHGSKPLQNPWYYEQIRLGFNYRMNDIQSALGLSQLKRIETVRGRRRQIVNLYNEAFRQMKHAQIPFESPECDSNFHLYVLLFDFEKMNINRAQFMLALKAEGIQTQVHYIPVHTQPFFEEHFGTGWGDCPVAEKYYSKCLSIPLYPAMTETDAERVYDEINRLASKLPRSRAAGH